MNVRILDIWNNYCPYQNQLFQISENKQSLWISTIVILDTRKCYFWYPEYIPGIRNMPKRRFISDIQNIYYGYQQ